MDKRNRETCLTSSAYKFVRKALQVCIAPLRTNPVTTKTNMPCTWPIAIPMVVKPVQDRVHVNKWASCILVADMESLRNARNLFLHCIQISSVESPPKFPSANKSTLPDSSFSCLLFPDSIFNLLQHETRKFMTRILTRRRMASNALLTLLETDMSDLKCIVVISTTHPRFCFKN